MSQTGLDVAVRRFSNRVLLKISGKCWRAYSVVEHVGRSSGRKYRNPVSAYPLGDGFVIAVLYGPESQWVRNVMATGGFVLGTKGQNYQLERPEIVGPEVALRAYSTFSQRMMRRRNIQHFVWGHRVRRPSMPTRLDEGSFRHFYRVINPVMRMLVRHLGVGGPSDDLLRLLRVRARKSGRAYDVPVRINTVNGERFVVAMFGTAQWVKNLRATSEAEIVLGKAAEPVQVHELKGGDKLAFVTTYMREPKLEKRVKAVLGSDPKRLSPDEFQRSIAALPVFRLEPVPTATR